LPISPRASLALKAALGLIVAIGLWRLASPPYHRFVAAGASLATARIAPSAILEEHEGKLRIGDRSLERKAEVALAVITGNVVLLIALFATVRWSWIALVRLTVAMMILIVTHIAAAVIAGQATLATFFGPWSDQHYGAVAQNLWFVAWQGYEIVGAYAIAFGLWWLLRPLPAEAAAGQPGAKRPAKKTKGPR
jgi:hypothetical protein